MTTLASGAGPDRPPPESLRSVVSAAANHLRVDNGSLWGWTGLVRWILVDSDVWWLAELDGKSDLIFRAVEPDPHVGVANTGMDWAGRRWAMVDCTDVALDQPDQDASNARLVQVLLHEAFHAFWQPAICDGVVPVQEGDASLATPEGRAAVIVELHAWAQVLASHDPDDLAAAIVARRWRRDRIAEPERRRQDYIDLWEGVPEYSALRWTGTSVQAVIDLASASRPAPPPGPQSKSASGAGWRLTADRPLAELGAIWSADPPDPWRTDHG